MAGLVPAIHVFVNCCEDVDARHKAGHDGRAMSGSSQPQRNLADEILLADLDAAMAENVVGRRAVEIEIRQHEVVEIVVAFHVALLFRAEREGDFAFGRSVDSLVIESLYEGDSL